MLPLHKFKHPTPWLRRPLLQSFVVVAAAVTLLSFTGLSRTHTYTLTWAEADASSRSQSSPSVSLSDLQQEYVVFPSQSQSSSPPQPRIQALPEWCIDAHFALGHTCAPHYYGNALHKGTGGEKFDLVWTWVNSSDSQLRTAMDDARREEGLELEEEEDIEGESNEPTEDKLYR